MKATSNQNAKLAGERPSSGVSSVKEFEWLLDNHNDDAAPNIENVIGALKSFDGLPNIQCFTPSTSGSTRLRTKASTEKLTVHEKALNSQTYNVHFGVTPYLSNVCSKKPSETIAQVEILPSRSGASSIGRTPSVDSKTIAPTGRLSFHGTEFLTGEKVVRRMREKARLRSPTAKFIKQRSQDQMSKDAGDVQNNFEMMSDAPGTPILYTNLSNVSDTFSNNDSPAARRASPPGGRSMGSRGRQSNSRGSTSSSMRSRKSKGGGKGNMPKTEQLKKKVEKKEELMDPLYSIMWHSQSEVKQFAKFFDEHGNTTVPARSIAYQICEQPMPMNLSPVSTRVEPTCSSAAHVTSVRKGADADAICPGTATATPLMEDRDRPEQPTTPSPITDGRRTSSNTPMPKAASSVVLSPVRGAKNTGDSLKSPARTPEKASTYVYRDVGTISPLCQVDSMATCQVAKPPLNNRLVGLSPLYKKTEMYCGSIPKTMLSPQGMSSKELTKLPVEPLHGPSMCNLLSDYQQLKPMSSLTALAKEVELEGNIINRILISPKEVDELIANSAAPIPSVWVTVKVVYIILQSYQTFVAEKIAHHAAVVIANTKKEQRQKQMEAVQQRKNDVDEAEEGEEPGDLRVISKCSSNNQNTGLARALPRKLTHMEEITKVLVELSKGTEPDQTEVTPIGEEDGEQNESANEEEVLPHRNHTIDDLDLHPLAPRLQFASIMFGEFHPADPTSHTMDKLDKEDSSVKLGEPSKDDGSLMLEHTNSLSDDDSDADFNSSVSLSTDSTGPQQRSGSRGFTPDKYWKAAPRTCKYKGHLEYDEAASHDLLLSSKSGGDSPVMTQKYTLTPEEIAAINRKIEEEHLPAQWKEFWSILGSLPQLEAIEVATSASKKDSSTNATLNEKNMRMNKLIYEYNSYQRGYCKTLPSSLAKKQGIFGQKSRPAADPNMVTSSTFSLLNKTNTTDPAAPPDDNVKPTEEVLKGFSWSAFRHLIKTRSEEFCDILRTISDDTHFFKYFPENMLPSLRSVSNSVLYNPQKALQAESIGGAKLCVWSRRVISLIYDVHLTKYRGPIPAHHHRTTRHHHVPRGVQADNATTKLTGGANTAVADSKMSQNTHTLAHANSLLAPHSLTSTTMSFREQHHLSAGTAKPKLRQLFASRPAARLHIKHTPLRFMVCIMPNAFGSGPTEVDPNNLPPTVPAVFSSQQNFISREDESNFAIQELSHGSVQVNVPTVQPSDSTVAAFAVTQSLVSPIDYIRAAVSHNPYCESALGKRRNDKVDYWNDVMHANLVTYHPRKQLMSMAQGSTTQMPIQTVCPRKASTAFERMDSYDAKQYGAKQVVIDGWNLSIDSDDAAAVSGQVSEDMQDPEMLRQVFMRRTASYDGLQVNERVFALTLDDIEHEEKKQLREYFDITLKDSSVLNPLPNTCITTLPTNTLRRMKSDFNLPNLQLNKYALDVKADFFVVGYENHFQDLSYNDDPKKAALEKAKRGKKLRASPPYLTHGWLLKSELMSSVTASLIISKSNIPATSAMRYIVALSDTKTSVHALSAACRLAKPCDVISVIHVVDWHRAANRDNFISIGRSTIFPHALITQDKNIDAAMTNSNSLTGSTDEAEKYEVTKIERSDTQDSMISSESISKDEDELNSPQPPSTSEQYHEARLTQLHFEHQHRKKANYDDAARRAKRLAKHCTHYGYNILVVEEGNYDEEEAYLTSILKDESVPDELDRCINFEKAYREMLARKIVISVNSLQQSFAHSHAYLVLGDGQAVDCSIVDDTEITVTTIIARDNHEK